MSVDVDISGPVAAIDNATKALDNQGTGPLGDAWKSVGAAGIDFAKGEFDKNSPGGGAWPPLAKSTIKAKGHSRILVQSGKLRRSLNKNGDNQILRLTGDGVEAGTKDPKAIYHQEGTTRMPRRVVLPKLSSEVKVKGLTIMSSATFQILMAASGPATPQVP